MAIQFERIDVLKKGEVAVRFRRDAFMVSFGTGEDFGPEDHYLKWLETRSAALPDGFMFAIEEAEPIGQIELDIRSFEGRTIGYINLFYLVPEKRGNGYGELLFHYAMEFFRKQGIREFHLRVSPTNIPAVRFYRKAGMEEVQKELDGKLVRMKGFIKAS